MFSKFIELQFMDGIDKHEVSYFTKLMEQERSKETPMLITPFIPRSIIKAYPVNNTGISSSSIVLRIIYRSLSI